MEERIASRINTNVTGATGLTKTGAMAFASVEQIMEFAKVMSLASVAVPKHLRTNPGACLAVAIQASEWEMSPFAVANKSYVVNDRIAYEAQMLNAVILKRAPIAGRFKISYSGDGAKRKCRVAVKLNAENGGEEVDFETPAIGDIPVKNSPLWKGDPDQQLFYYASRGMCRRHFPDVILGVYAVDEIQDTPELAVTSVREIPRAQIGDVKPAESKAVESEVIPPDKVKPEPNPGKLPKAKVETGPAKQAELPGSDVDVAKSPEAVLRDLLTVAQFSEADVCAMAVAMKLVPAGTTTVAALGPKVIAAIIEDWSTAIDTMKQMAAK